MNWTILMNSLLVAAATAVVAGAAGSAIALFACALAPRFQRMLLALAVIALALPPFFVTNAWLDLLGANGLLKPWLSLNIFSLPGAVLVLSLLTWPVAFLLVWAAWQQLSASQLEAEPALRGRALVRWVLVPLGWPQFGIALAISFVLALNNFSVPSLLQVKVFPAEMWVSYNTQLDVARAFAVGWPMLLAPLLLLLALRALPHEWPRDFGQAASIAFKRQVGAPLLSVAAVVAVFVAVASIILPIAQLSSSSRTVTEFIPAAAAGLNALGNSAAYAGGAAALTAIAGLSLAHLRGARAAWLTFFVPGIVLGVAITTGLNQPGLGWLYPSAALVIVALAVRYLAITWTAARFAITNVDSTLLDVARLETASRWKLFWHVELPQIAAPVAASAYLVYLLCLWDVETSILIIPPGGETLAVRIFNLLHYGHTAHVNALCLLLLLLALLPLAITPVWSGIVRWLRHRDEQAAAASAALVLILASGCSDAGTAAANIDSRLFERVEIIGRRGTAPGEFNKPRTLAVDGNDNLFVADMTGRIQKFSPSGEYLLSWQMPQIELGKPKGMDRDRQGNIVIVEPHYQRVNHFRPDGTLAVQWGQSGTNAGHLALPRAVAVDSKSNLIVSEYWAVERVQKFSPNGRALLASWGRPGLAHGEFNRPEGIGVDAADRIYVADSCNHRIQVFSPEGRFLHAYGRAGSQRGELNYPYDVRVDGRGLQFVCEFGNSRIQVFDASHQPVEIIGRAGANPGEFANPWSIALDSKGNLYVADSQNHRVQKFIRATTSSQRNAPASGQFVLLSCNNVLADISARNMTITRTDPTPTPHFHR